VTLLVIMFDVWVVYLLVSSKFGKTPPTVHSDRKAIATMIKAAAAEIKTGTKVVDLGSGCGKVVLAFAKAFPKAKLVGYEFGRLPMWVANKRNRYPNVQFEKCDFIGKDLTKFKVIVTFLYVKTHRLLLDQYEAMPKGAVLISNHFIVPFGEGSGWVLESEDDHVLKYRKVR
jgi:hypothetical protein